MNVHSLNLIASLNASVAAASQHSTANVEQYVDQTQNLQMQFEISKEIVLGYCESTLTPTIM